MDTDKTNSMTAKEIYQPTEKAQAFLDKVENGKYDRGIIRGLQKFIDNKVPEEMQGFYSAEELQELIDLKNTSQDVESRMPVKITITIIKLQKIALLFRPWLRRALKKPLILKELQILANR